MRASRSVVRFEDWAHKDNINAACVERTGKLQVYPAHPSLEWYPIVAHVVISILNCCCVSWILSHG